MKNRLWGSVDNIKNHKRIVNLYMILTVIATVAPFAFGTSVSPDLVYLIGNRTLFLNPLLLGLWAADIGLRWLTRICAVVLLSYPVALIAAYFLARIGKKYLPHVIAALFDVAFTVFLAVASICTAEFYFVHVLMFAGAAINLWFAVSFLLIRTITKQRNSQKEMT